MAAPETHPAFLLAGSSELRLAHSAAEAERELAAGFRPSFMLLDLREDRGRGEAFVREVATHPDCSGIPILEISGTGQRLRFTLLNHLEALSRPSQLEELLRILEDVCAAVPE
jgi:hypothetical protein